MKPLLSFLLYPAQQQFLDATEPIRGFIGGQGAGKSKVGAFDLLMKARPGRLYMVVAPIYPMLRDATFRTFRDTAQSLGLWGGFYKTEFVATIYTRWGGTAEVLFRSGEKYDRLRGPNLTGLWIDEASLLKHEAFQIGVARLREGSERGWMTATFTPAGLSHWTFDVFGRPSPGVFLVQAATSDNPFVSDKFIETVTSQFAGLRAEQELQGKFVAVEGAEWTSEYFPASIWFDEWPDDLVVTTLALDPAQAKGEKTKGCYSSFVLAGVDKTARVWCEAWMSQRWDARELVAMTFELYQVHKPQAVVVETNFGQGFMMELLVQEAKRRGVILPLYAINNSEDKEVRIRRLGPGLAQGLRRFRAGSASTELLVQQMKDFPVGPHRDGPDALEMAERMVYRLLVGGQKGVESQPVAYRGHRG